MTPHVAMDMATWLLLRLVPKDLRESLMGDLTEEFVWRTGTASLSAARRWYFKQICTSVPHLLWLMLARATWLATLGVALLAYVGVGLVQVVIYWTIPSSAAPVHSPVGLVIVFPIVLIIGYVAEQFRRRAAVVLSGMMLLAITMMSVLTTESAPLWYRLAYFVVGPAAALIGGALRRSSAIHS
jgi:hypothetical protein